MAEFKKMIIIPEKTFKVLQENKEKYNTISPDIFDGDIDSKLMETLKNSLVKILNSDKVDKTTISRYKSDLAKLLDLELPEKPQMQVTARDTDPEDYYAKLLGLESLEKPEKKEEEEPNKDNNYSSYISDMDTTDNDTKFITSSESDLYENSFIGDLSDRTSTPNKDDPSYLDETLRNPSPTGDLSSRRTLKFWEGDITPILSSTNLRGESKSTTQNAKNIEDFILKNAPDRIKRNSKDSFYIDDKKIKGMY